MNHSAVEDSFFEKVGKTIRTSKKTAFVRDSNFADIVTSGLLKLTSIQKVDPDAEITHSRNGGIDIKFKKSNVAFDIMQYLSLDNPEDAFLGEGLIGFDADEEMIQKSTNPLWVVKPASDGKSVSIRRTWEKG